MSLTFCMQMISNKWSVFKQKKIVWYKSIIGYIPPFSIELFVLSFNYTICIPKQILTIVRRKFSNAIIIIASLVSTEIVSYLVHCANSSWDRNLNMEMYKMSWITHDLNLIRCAKFLQMQLWSCKILKLNYQTCIFSLK